MALLGRTAPVEDYAGHRLNVPRVSHASQHGYIARHPVASVLFLGCAQLQRSIPTRRPETSPSGRVSGTARDSQTLVIALVDISKTSMNAFTVGRHRQPKYASLVSSGDHTRRSHRYQLLFGHFYGDEAFKLTVRVQRAHAEHVHVVHRQEGGAITVLRCGRCRDHHFVLEGRDFSTDALV